MKESKRKVVYTMLRPKQIKCLQLMIQGNMTDKKIAESINVAQKTICEWKKNDVEFQNEYNELMRKSLQYAAPKAFRKQMSLLDSKNDMVAHLAAKDIMDRAGFNPTEKVEQAVDISPIVIRDNVEE